MSGLIILPAPDSTDTCTKKDLGEWLVYMGIGAAQVIHQALLEDATEEQRAAAQWLAIDLGRIAEAAGKHVAGAKFNLTEESPEGEWDRLADMARLLRTERGGLESPYFDYAIAGVSERLEREIKLWVGEREEGEHEETSA